MPSTPNKGGHENDKPQARRDSEMVLRDIIRRPSRHGHHELDGLSEMKDPHWAEPSYSYWAKRLYRNFLQGGGRPDFFCRWAELNNLPIKKRDARKLVRVK